MVAPCFCYLLHAFTRRILAFIIENRLMCNRFIGLALRRIVVGVNFEDVLHPFAFVLVSVFESVIG